ncbi:MAG: hypothetical protein Q4E47_00995 [Candidatus Saccharibacteria bacterium]|nr:hypothetical protein [Candidatus Saccharibacteria bacterium]
MISREKLKEKTKNDSTTGFVLDLAEKVKRGPRLVWEPAVREQIERIASSYDPDEAVEFLATEFDLRADEYHKKLNIYKIKHPSDPEPSELEVIKFIICDFMLERCLRCGDCNMEMKFLFITLKHIDFRLCLQKACSALGA